MAASTIARGRRRLLILVALFAAGTLGLIALILSQLVHVTTAPEYRLITTFDNVSGLVEGDQVKVGGVPVGAVDEIAVVKGKAQVSMLVETRVRLPEDSEVAVRWRNAIGQRVIQITPGAAERLLPSQPGALVRSKKGRSVVDVGELLNDLYPLTLDRDPGWANKLLQAFSTALDGKETDVDKLMSNVAVLSGSVASRKATITQMIKDTKVVTATISKRDKQIAQMVDNLMTLTGKFADNRTLIDTALKELSGMIVTSDKVLGRNAEELGLFIDQTKELTGGVGRNVKTVKSVLQELGPFLRRAQGPINEGAFAKLGLSCTNIGPGPSCPLPMELPGLSGDGGASGDSLSSVVLGEGR